MRAHILLGLVAVISILMWQCTSDIDKEVPPHIIPLKKMANIQADVLLINQHLKTLSLPDSSQQMADSAAIYFNGLFEKYNITKQDYDSSLPFYENNVPLLDSLYKASINKLNVLKTQR